VGSEFPEKGDTDFAYELRHLDCASPGTPMLLWMLEMPCLNCSSRAGWCLRREGVRFQSDGDLGMHAIVAS